MDLWMAKMNFIPGQGLGKMNQGEPTPLQFTSNPGKAGLGYPQKQSRGRKELQRVDRHQNHQPAASINALIPNEESPDPVHLIYDTPKTQAGPAHNQTTLSYKHA